MTDAPRVTFIFVGADRCGSKWLHQTFRGHPDCFVPEIADPYFFDRQYHRGIDWYLGLFRDAPPDALAVGEFSHDYIHSSVAAARILADLPGVRILMTLRHPVERAYSDWAHSNAVGLAPDSFEDALEEVATLLGNSTYSEKIESYFGLFGRDKVHVMLYDRLLSDPRGLAADAFDFVGLPKTDRIDYERVINPFRVSRGAWGGRVARTLADFLRATRRERLLGRVRQSAGVRRVFFREARRSERPAMDAATRGRLLEYFDPEVTALESLLDADLTAWRR